MIIYCYNFFLIKSRTRHSLADARDNLHLLLVSIKFLGLSLSLYSTYLPLSFT